jgi:hypothetical protein
VVHMVLKSNLHQAQYAEQVRHWILPVCYCSLPACRAVAVEAAESLHPAFINELLCSCRHSAC